MSKCVGLVLVTLILVLSALVALPAEAADSFSVNSVVEHHAAELNSDMPYVAGFHVNTEDLPARSRQRHSNHRKLSFN